METSNNDLSDINELEDMYIKLNQSNNSVYRFFLAYNDYINSPRDYGTGDFLSMMEAHVLTDIVDNPGTTVTEISKIWGRTTSAISQTVRKLIKKNYVYRVNSDTNAKFFFLYPTETAIEFARCHKEYDTKNMAKIKSYLLKHFSEEEVSTFYKVLFYYTYFIKDPSVLEI